MGFQNTVLKSEYNITLYFLFFSCTSGALIWFLTYSWEEEGNYPLELFAEAPLFPHNFTLFSTKASFENEAILKAHSSQAQ